MWLRLGGKKEHYKMSKATIWIYEERRQILVVLSGLNWLRNVSYVGIFSGVLYIPSPNLGM
jgi:hypothetical protein